MARFAPLQGPPEIKVKLNLRYKDYLWLDDQSPYVSGKGDPRKDSGQWVIDGLPDRG